MRKLQTHDVFMALKVINAAQIKDEVKRIALLVQSKKKLDVQDVGLEFILGCMEKMSGTKAEKAFYDLLAGPLELEASEIETMDPLELIEKIKDLKEVIDMDGLKAFFKSVSALMK